MAIVGVSDNDQFAETVVARRFGEPNSVTGAAAPVVVGHSAAMRLVLDQSEAVAKTDSTVLITETAPSKVQQLTTFFSQLMSPNSRCC